MKTLKIEITNKGDAIKAINKFRLENKNQWYQIELRYLPFTYKMKCFDTWIQLFYQYDNNDLILSDGGLMDISVKEFKQYLINRIE